MTRRALFRVHSWIGVFAGLVLFVICWSGTFAVLSHEVDWLLNPDIRSKATEGEPASWGEIERAVQNAFPTGEITFFEAPRGPGYAAQVGVDLPEHPYLRVYVDPYTAEVSGWTSYFNVQRFFRSFHMNLFSGAVGYYVVFTFSLFLLASLILPFFFYKRWWRGFFKLETRRGARVFWSDAHKLAGLWSAWFSLVIALTGVWYLTESLRVDVGDGKVAWSGTGEYAVNVITPLEAARDEPELALDEMIARVTDARPDLRVHSIWREAGYLYVDGQAGHLLVRDRANKLYLDPRTGKVAYDQEADEQPAWWRWSDTADPLHFGDFGGLATKLIWFIFGILLSGLALTGAWLHAQRLLCDRGPRTRWRGVGVAYCATGLMLAASVWGGFAELKSYGPLVEGVRRFPEIPLSVALFVFGWIAVTLVIVTSWLLSVATRSIASWYRADLLPDRTRTAPFEDEPTAHHSAMAKE